MAYVILIVFILIFYSKFSDVKTSINKLESEIAQLKKQINSGTSAPAPAMIQDTAASQQPMNPASVAQNAAPMPPVPATPGQIEAWFQENLLLKVGMLMVLAGFGWFVSYAFIHDWISPAGRIMIGFAAGTVIMIFGMLRLGKNQTQGNMLTILGSALIVITALAGQYYYNFFPPGAVLCLIFLVSICISFSAVSYSMERLAAYGLLMSLSAPLFSHVASISMERLAAYGLLMSLSAPLFSHVASMDTVILYLYLAVISLGAIWVAVVKGWQSVTLIGITGILLYSVSYGSVIVPYDAKYAVAAILYAICLLYTSVSTWSLIRNKKDSSPEEVFITVVNTILILIGTLTIIPTGYQSLMLAGWIAVYAVSGSIVLQKTKSDKLFYIHSLVAVLFLAVATSIELSGPTLVIAFAVEAALVSMASYVISKKIGTAELFGFLMAVPCIMSLPSLFSSAWSAGIFNSDCAVLMIMGAVFALLGLFYQTNQSEADEETVKGHQIAFIIASFYAFATFWLSAHSLFADKDTAVFISLLFFTITGLTCYFSGLFYRTSVLKGYGTALLVLVVARLILVDVWNMELTLRVITFVVLGIMFMSTAFISKKQKAITQP